MPSSSSLNIIIDTNLWISFLIGKQLASLKVLIFEGHIQPVFSQKSIEELVLVTQRPKLQKYFPKDKFDELLIFLRAVSLFIQIQSEIAVCRDP